MAKRQTVRFVLFIAVFFAFAQSAYAQNKEKLFSTGDVLIAEEPLPSKVYLAQKNTIKIMGRFYSKDDPDSRSFNVYGSGFLEKGSGLIVTARHLFVETIFDTDRSYIDSSEFYAIVEDADSIDVFPLTFVAASKVGTYGDVMLFKPTNKKLTVNPLELSFNASVGDEVYVSGFTVHFSHYHDTSGGTIPVLVDEVKFNFKNKISDIRENPELFAAGVSRIYRLVDHAQGGFSGGPGLNSQGQVLGITIEANGAFAYLISSRDIKNLILSVPK